MVVAQVESCVALELELEELGMSLGLEWGW